MRTLIITAAALLALGASSVVNASPDSATHPKTGIMCLDVGGESRPPVCRGSSSRISQGYDICLCGNAQRVEAPVCDKGERPIAESRTYELARKEAARDGSLFGDRYEGRQMCVRARNS